MLATGADPAERDRLGALSTRVFAATGADDASAERADAVHATRELERTLDGGPIPMAEPTFVALSQTMARLLANALLALVGNPGEYSRLRAQPSLLPNAVEELLRFSGIVRRVFRRAAADAEIGGITIREGELATLMLASANRDPLQFPNPNSLQLDRAIPTQVSLGFGRNACIGAIPVRMGISAAVGVLVNTFPAIELRGVGEWRAGSGFWFPASVDVTLLR
jgi:cytochrome P450